jgi:hypothetical protein
MLRCPPTVGPFFLLLPFPLPRASWASPPQSPPRPVFPGPPGALWADVLGFDCLVTVTAASGWTLVASDGGGLKFRAPDADAGTQKAGGEGQWPGAEGAGGDWRCLPTCGAPGPSRAFRRGQRLGAGSAPPHFRGAGAPHLRSLC